MCRLPWRRGGGCDVSHCRSQEKARRSQCGVRAVKDEIIQVAGERGYSPRAWCALWRCAALRYGAWCLLPSSVHGRCFTSGACGVLTAIMRRLLLFCRAPLSRG